jgi:molybdopterin converting factor subunit 1
MQITVRLFALMREKAGTDTIHLKLPDNTNIAEALTVLQRQHPSLEPYIDNTRFALQMEFVEPETILQAGDELALIPPVSGGISCLKSPRSP